MAGLRRSSVVPARSRLLLIVSATLLAAPASASQRRPLKTPVSMLITLGAQEARVEGLRFSGTPSLNGTPLPPVDLHGAQLGLHRPVLLETALHIDGDFHHVAFGATFGLLTCGRTVGLVTPPADRNGSLTGFYFGPEIATVWSIRNFDVRAGVAFGYRAYSFPLVGFDTVPCGKNGSSRCQPTISSDGFFFRPTISMGGHYRGMSFGVYGGGDPLLGGGWNAGTYIGFENQIWRDQAAISRPN
jgi:hypothetical protein